MTASCNFGINSTRNWSK